MILVFLVKSVTINGEFVLIPALYRLISCRAAASASGPAAAALVHAGDAKRTPTTLLGSTRVGFLISLHHGSAGHPSSWQNSGNYPGSSPAASTGVTELSGRRTPSLTPFPLAAVAFVAWPRGSGPSAALSAAAPRSRARPCGGAGRAALPSAAGTARRAARNGAPKGGALAVPARPLPPLFPRPGTPAPPPTPTPRLAAGPPGKAVAGAGRSGAAGPAHPPYSAGRAAAPPAPPARPARGERGSARAACRQASPPPAAGDGGAGGGFFGLLLLPVVVFSRVKSGAGGAAAAKAGGPLAQRRERGAAGPGSPSRGGGTGRVCLRGGASWSALAASVPVRLVHSGCWGWFACFICLGFLTPIYALFFFFSHLGTGAVSLLHSELLTW